jgi:hypothetical protein
VIAIADTVVRLDAASSVPADLEVVR